MRPLLFVIAGWRRERAIDDYMVMVRFIETMDRCDWKSLFGHSCATFGKVVNKAHDKPRQQPNTEVLHVEFMKQSNKMIK